MTTATMITISGKTRVLELMHQLPDDATFDQIVDELNQIHRSSLSDNRLQELARRAEEDDADPENVTPWEVVRERIRRKYAS